MARPNMSRPKPLAELIDGCLDKALAQQGFVGSDVILSWPDIVGERLARFSQPIKMDWPKRRPGTEGRADPATLVVRVEGAFAIELQHMAPQVVERVNAFYGWRCVGRLVLKQGPVRRAVPEKAPDLSLTAPERDRVASATETVADEALRQALGRLGTAVIATERQSRARR
jgi:hypothetical protein